MKALIKRLVDGDSLTLLESQQLFDSILGSEDVTVEVAAVLTVFAKRLPTIQELTGAVTVLRERGTRVELDRSGELIDICGTGGDHKGTFNISTTVAFVLAGCGVRVAKHGNYGATSACGSSNLLEYLGVKFSSDSSVLNRSLERSNVCYLHAPLFQSALAALRPIRQALPFRTIFNLMGPLINPAQPSKQLIGVATPGVFRLYRHFLEQRSGAVTLVSSLDGYDEISLTDRVLIAEKGRVDSVSPEDLGLKRVAAEMLRCGDTVKDAARFFLAIFDEDVNPAIIDVVAVNAAYALRSFRPGRSIAELINEARASLSERRALARLNDFMEANR